MCWSLVGIGKLIGRPSTIGLGTPPAAPSKPFLLKITLITPAAHHASLTPRAIYSGDANTSPPNLDNLLTPNRSTKQYGFCRVSWEASNRHGSGGKQSEGENGDANQIRDLLPCPRIRSPSRSGLDRSQRPRGTLARSFGVHKR